MDTNSDPNNWREEALLCRERLNGINWVDEKEKIEKGGKSCAKEEGEIIERTNPPPPNSPNAHAASYGYSSDEDEVEVIDVDSAKTNRPNIDRASMNTQVIDSDEEPEVKEQPKKKRKTVQTTLFDSASFMFKEKVNKKPEEEVLTYDISPAKHFRKGDLVMCTAQSAGHPQYIKNVISGGYVMIGKVAAYVEKTKLDDEGNKISDMEAYLDVRFSPIKISDGTHHSSSMCGLIPMDEVMKVASYDDGNLSKVDEGTAVNVMNGFRFCYGRWCMKYTFGI